MGFSTLEIRSKIGSLAREARRENLPFIEVLHSKIDALNEKTEAGEMQTRFSTNGTSGEVKEIEGQNYSDNRELYQIIEEAYDNVIVSGVAPDEIDLLEAGMKLLFPRVTSIVPVFCNQPHRA